MPQQLARDEAGNVFDVSDPNNPILVRQAAAPTPSYIPPSAARQAQDARTNAREDVRDARAAEDQDLQRKSAARAAQAAALQAQAANRQAGAAERTVGNTRFDNIALLRKEFTGRKEVADFQTILPMVASAMTIARNPKATGADDLNLIYTFGKVMDPGSVVREGELALASGTGSFAQSIEGAISKLQSGERLPDAVRHNLVESMRRRGVELSRSYNLSRRDYQERAKRFGFNPIDVVGEHPAKPFQQVEADFTGKPIGNLDGSPGASPTQAATGGTKVDRNPAREKALDALLRAGADDAQINATSRALGGMDFDPADLARSREAVSKGFKGRTFDTSVEVPTTALNRASASGPAVGFVGLANGLSAGMLDEGIGAANSLLTGKPMAQTIEEANRGKQAGAEAHPIWSAGGNMAGLAGSSALGGAGLARVGLSAALGKATPYAADAALGAISGAGEANGNRLWGAGVGAAGGAIGRGIGEKVLAPAVGAAMRTAPALAVARKARGIFGARMLPEAPRLSPADQDIAGAIRGAAPDTETMLLEAQRLGLPMALADTSAPARELTAAAVRRSPAASQIAEDTLIPRNRGQYDRFSAAVTRDLGPTTNIPQRSADMMAEARTAASGLYDQAYSNPVPSTPELDAVLGTPFGRQAVGRARTIAANERRSPDELGFALDADGNVALNPRPNDAIAQHLGARADFDAAQEAYRAARQTPGANVDQARDAMMSARENLRAAEQRLNAAPDPSSAASVPAYTTQTLDYVKRGMDDVLEEQRNPITGRLQLDEAGRAQNGVRGQLLSEVDRLNPDFAAARQAYAGPMASRDALSRGVDAYGLHPDELGMQVANQTPEHLGQMQLGYRGTLMDHAGKVRDSSNPWEATLGSPVARNRLGTMFPGSPGVPNLLRQRALESQLQQTSNAVLGNSKTAQRQIADEAFSGGGFANAAEAGVNALTGGGAGQITRMAASRAAAAMAKTNIGKRAIAKADAVVPVMLNTAPAEALANMRALMARDDQYRAFVEATTPRRKLGLFGRALGASTSPMLVE